MNRFSPLQSVGSIVVAAPGAANVFERLGLDYCCGGGKSLADACARAGLEADVVLAELDAVSAPPPAERDWSKESASALIAHIEAVHHTFMRRELTAIAPRMERVLQVHGTNHPEAQLPRMAAIWGQAAAELWPHLEKEEQILFPMIRALEAGRAPSMHCGVEGPIHVMEMEHDQVGAAFAELRTLADGYRVPAHACTTWRALWAALDAFEADLHRHVHLENNVLFPKARALAGL
jgi:regulator of cell morphogenesis and NO signaling